MSSFFKKHRVSKPNCPACKLDGQCHTPRMPITGAGKEKILIINSSPSNEDDRSGKPLMGSAGNLLKTEFRLLGINISKDCWVTNAVNCRTPINKQGGVTEPNSKQIGYCRPHIDNVIKELKPSKIILLGSEAIESFYSHRNSKCSGVTKMAGLKLWDSTHKAWVFPIWHPNWLHAKNKDMLFKSEYKRVLKRAVNADDAPLKKKWNKYHILLDFKKAIEALTDCLQNDTLIAIDFETTGLNMYMEGHSTVSFSWANDRGAWAVPVQHPHWKRHQQKQIFTIIRKILRKRKIRKIVQGINFEYAWTKQQFKVVPRNFAWCTQLATHVLDNRSGITPLKLQCFIRWGIEDYDKISSQYIKSDKSYNGFNNMLKMPLDALLEYNALDSLYTFELYQEQVMEFQGNELDAYNFLHAGAIVMCEMSHNGIRIEKEYYLQQKAKLEQERDDLINDIETSREAKLYMRKYGKKFDYNSPKDLQIMLFTVLMLKPVKETKTGNSVDEEVLTKLDTPLTKNIIAVRKLNKMIGTYVDGFLKHTYYGMMHPSFSLARARSFRSSSQSPNFQNIPKRDPKAKRITRAGMVPRNGNVLGEMDFEGAEISTSCYYHKDPTFIEYQTEGGGDMHKDACAEILKIKPEEVPKQARQATKGIWTFSQFYGSYYVSCAKQGWEEYPLLVDNDGNPLQIRGMDIGDWMIEAFGSYKNFENHLKKFQDKFWNDWFKVYTKWKDEVCDFYRRNGYVETFLGFRFKGYMDSKQCTNYPIQGTSFHLLVYTAVQFWKECNKRGLETLIVGQVHDSLILDIPVEEIDEVKEILSEIVGTLHEKFKWMDFPMGLDLELSKSYEEGGSFSEMTKAKL